MKETKDRLTKLIIETSAEITLAILNNEVQKTHSYRVELNRLVDEIIKLK